MQKIPYNAALALLLSLGLSACSINTGKGSQGDTTARTSASSLIATTTADSSSADNTSSDNTASNNANNMGSNDSTDATDSSASDNNASNSDSNEEPYNDDDTESTLSNIGGVGVTGSYAETYLTSLNAQDELFAAVQQANNLTAGSCAATGGRNAANHPCSVGSVAEGGIIGSYTLKDSNGQSLGAYAVIREAYSERENPTNSYIAMINTPTTERSAVVNATYHGVASYSFNNRPNMATRDFELNVTDNSVSGSAYYIAATGNRVTAVTFESGQIGEEFGNITFSGKTSFNNNLLPGLGNSEGRYQGWFVGQNAEGVVGTFSTSSQGSNASVQGAFAAQK